MANYKKSIVYNDQGDLEDEAEGCLQPMS
jgi:hypothetical protein